MQTEPVPVSVPSQVPSTSVSVSVNVSVTTPVLSHHETTNPPPSSTIPFVVSQNPTPTPTATVSPNDTINANQPTTSLTDGSPSPPSSSSPTSTEKDSTPSTSSTTTANESASKYTTPSDSSSLLSPSSSSSYPPSDLTVSPNAVTPIRLHDLLPLNMDSIAFFNEAEALEACDTHDFLAEVLGDFIAECDEFRSQLSTAISTHDIAYIIDKAHAIKGAAANLRLVRLAEIAKRMEYAGKQCIICKDNGNTLIGSELLHAIQLLFVLLQQDMDKVPPLKEEMLEKMDQ